MAKHRVRLKRRVRLPKRVDVWKPKWEPEIKGFAFNYIRENQWRCEQIHSIDDLMQDAYLVFCKVRDSYPLVVDPPHFMSLYKTSLRNSIFDKAREYERKLGLIDETVEVKTEPFAQDNIIAHDFNEGELAVLIEKGPPELRLLINFLQDEENLERLRAPQRTQKRTPRMTIDQRLSYLLGIDVFPFRETLKYLLS